MGRFKNFESTMPAHCSS